MWRQQKEELERSRTPGSSRPQGVVLSWSPDLSLRDPALPSDCLASSWWSLTAGWAFAMLAKLKANCRASDLLLGHSHIHFLLRLPDHGNMTMHSLLLYMGLPGRKWHEYQVHLQSQIPQASQTHSVAAHVTQGEGLGLVLGQTLRTLLCASPPILLGRTHTLLAVSLAWRLFARWTSFGEREMAALHLWGMPSLTSLPLHPYGFLWLPVPAASLLPQCNFQESFWSQFESLSTSSYVTTWRARCWSDVLASERAVLL